MSDEMLRLPDEIARVLNVPEKTVYSATEKSPLQGFKVGAQWRFKRGDLDKWIEDRKAASRHGESK